MNQLRHAGLGDHGVEAIGLGAAIAQLLGGHDAPAQAAHVGNTILPFADADVLIDPALPLKRAGTKRPAVYVQMPCGDGSSGEEGGDADDDQVSDTGIHHGAFPVRRRSALGTFSIVWVAKNVKGNSKNLMV